MIIVPERCQGLELRVFLVLLLYNELERATSEQNMHWTFMNVAKWILHRP